MKSFKFVGVISVLVLLISGAGFAQSPEYTLGLVSSHFHNFKSDQGMSSMDNPFGNGLMLGIGLNQNVAFSLAGEYMKDDMPGNGGDWSDTRLAAMVHIFPVQWKNVRPYVSGGVDYLRHSVSGSLLADETDHSLQLRQSIGFDFQLTPYMALNFDVAAYSDGLNYLGHANSFCVRYSL